MKKLIILLVSLSLIQLSFGQFKTDLSPMVNYQSPNSATLGKFGDVPVSLYTGTPDISVPIYKITERNIELDINLQYDAKGVRVEDVPGWVGQNWSLNAGGVITRTVRGTAFDELNFFHGKNLTIANLNPSYAEWVTSNGGQTYMGVTQRGYYYHKNKLNVSNWNDYNYLYNLAYSSYFYNVADTQAYLLAQNYRMDLEPDLFTFNFMGHTGRFFLGQDGEWKVSSDSNLKVVCDMSTDVSYLVPPVPYGDLFGYGTTLRARFPKQLNKIKLIDDKGNTFFFEEVELTFNDAFYNLPGENMESRCISSAFYLTKITDIYNNILFTFEYEKGPWQGRFSNSYNNSLLRDPNTETPVTTGTAVSVFDPNQDIHGNSFNGSGQLILPSYLKKITTESGIEIKFNSELVQNAFKYIRGGGNPLFDINNETLLGATRYNSPNLYFLYKEPDMITESSVQHSIYNVWDRMKNKKLTSVNIKDNSNNTLNVNFDYLDVSNARLFLKGINFNYDQFYHFVYKNIALPQFLNTSTDRLGYYNAIPFKFTTSAYDNNYWANEIHQLKVTNDNVLNGSLSKIVYPTGGYTEFVFEPHTYSKKVNGNNVLINENGLIGGLRIKKIINNFGNQLETREYIYKKSLLSNATSSGNLLYNPIYYKESGSIVHPLSQWPDKLLVNKTLNSIIPMSNFMGVQLEYTDVFEKISGLGYTHYKFSNFEEFPDLNPVVLHNAALPFVPKTDRSYERGNLKEKLVYNENNILLHRKKLEYFSEYTYSSNAVNINFSYKIGRSFGGPGFDYWMLPFTTAYKLNYGDKRLTKEETFDYFDAGNLLYNLKQYIYNTGISSNLLINNGNLFKRKEYNLSSEINKGILKEYEYPFDNSNIANNTLVNKNYLSIIGEKNKRIEGDPVDPLEEEDVMEQKTIFSTFYNNTLNQVLPIPAFSMSKKGIQNLEEEITYTQFDIKGNNLEYYKRGSIPVSVIWGYNNTKPIAILENVKYTDINSSILLNLLGLSNIDIDNGINGVSESKLRNALNNLRVNFPNAMIKTYTYDPILGTTSITEPNGDSIYYEYDNMLRLKYLKDRDNNILKEYEYHFKPSFNPED